MLSKTGFASSHQLKSYVASKSRLKLAARYPVILQGQYIVTVGHNLAWTPTGRGGTRAPKIVNFRKFWNINAMFHILNFVRFIG